ncbi:PHOsphatase [Globomyces sp. JEL0801]|nr:PHOsphatase [Globomyces sp. JEL0801]
MMKLNNPVRAAIFCVLALVALFFGVYFGIQAFTSKPSTRSFNVGASLGSKSPYPIGNYSSYQGSCKLVQVQMYCRHGVRYGTSKNLQNMFDLARMFRGNSSKINDSKLSNLTVPFPEDQPGFQNLKDFGKRWLTRYPQLVNLQSISLRSSNSSRVMNSAESFMKGLLDGQAPSVNNSIIGDRATDADINPTISCSKYMVEENLHEAEAKSFKSLAFTSMAERISKRIGFQLSLDQSLTLLDLCVAQIGLLEYNTTDGVCYLFEQKDFQNYGLLDNVDKYYSLGYGHSINTQMTCSAWTGIYNEMKNARKKGPSMSLRFTQ